MAALSSDRIVLPAEPASVRAARSAVDAYAGSLGADDDVRDCARLLVSETVTNALVHGCRQQAAAAVTLAMSVGGNRLRVEVGDVSDVTPCRRTVGPDDEGGRGLALLDAVAAAWGVLPGAPGKTVWFELPLRG